MFTGGKHLKVFNTNDVEFKTQNRRIPHYNYKSSVIDSSTFGSEDLGFDIKILEPGQLSYPYHYHSSVEEIYLILDGEVTLRQDNELRILNKGDLVFLEKLEKGSHQLFNHSSKPVKYLGVSSKNKDDKCYYPDSSKINVGKNQIFKLEDNVDYFEGEESIPLFWENSKE